MSLPNYIRSGYRMIQSLMRIFTPLRKFNTIAFAILSVLAIAFLIVGFVQFVRQMHEYNNHYSDNQSVRPSDGPLSAERIDAGDRIMTLYGKGDMNDQCLRDLHFIDSRDGSSVRFGDNPDQEFCNGQVVGVPRTKEMHKGYGYVALAKLGERDGKPLVDVLFIRFSDMKIFKIASSIRMFDGAHELDGKTFSAIIWDASDRGRFVIFDNSVGRITVTKDLDLMGRPSLESEAPQPATAPRNKYH